MTVSLSSIQKIVPDNPVFPTDFLRISPGVDHIYVQSDNWDDILARPRLAIVGSRKVSPYGRHATELLATELAKAGVVIVSGLAIGIDAIAHNACLAAGGITVAILPGSLQRIYPASHTSLAQRIIRQGGALVTEYDEGVTTYPSNFIARNRLIAAFADAVLITEASEKSGTMHTARFALEQGKDVLAVPGAITSQTSRGTHNLIKSGAALITCADDVLHILGITPTSRHVPRSDNPHEQRIIDLLSEQSRQADALLALSNLPIELFNQTLTMLEIKGLIRPLGGNQWGL